MQADMFNLYPAIGAVNALIRNYNFTMLFNEKSGFDQVENPRYLRNSKEQLASLQRDLALAKKETLTHRKLRHQIAKLHQKIACQRLDFTYKETAKLVKVAALIATEKITVKNMTRSAKGTAEKQGKNVKQKAG